MKNVGAVVTRAMISAALAATFVTTSAQASSFSRIPVYPGCVSSAANSYPYSTPSMPNQGYACSLPDRAELEHSTWTAVIVEWSSGNPAYCSSEGNKARVCAVVGDNNQYCTPIINSFTDGNRCKAIISGYGLTALTQSAGLGGAAWYLQASGNPKVVTWWNY